MARKKHHEEHIDETWLIPYSDLLTLLLALFIVLFAASNVDAEKYQAIRQAFSTEFGGGGVMPDAGPGFFPGVVGPEASEPTPTPDPETGPGLPDPELTGLLDALTSYVSANSLTEHMRLNLSSEGVLITLSSDVWFASGSASLSPQMRAFAVTLSELLVQNQRERGPLDIVITGHTDNVPISGGSFRSNWHLSANRAVNFMEIMLENPAFDPRHFSARGYGEYEPIADNLTSEGRQRNRRVEVLVSLDKSQK